MIKKFNELNMEEESVLFSNKWLKVIEYENWTIVETNDCVIVVPILLDSSQIVLREEYIPTYKKVNNGKSVYLNVISGTIETGENMEDCLKRELIEEAGIELNSNVNVEFDDPLYVSKGCNSKYNICLLPLRNNDFSEIYAKGDGSYSESKSKSIKVDICDIKDLKSYDTITELILYKLKFLFI